MFQQKRDSLICNNYSFCHILFFIISKHLSRWQLLTSVWIGISDISAGNIPTTASTFTLLYWINIKLSSKLEPSIITLSHIPMLVLVRGEKWCPRHPYNYIYTATIVFVQLFVSEQQKHFLLVYTLAFLF